MGVWVRSPGGLAVVAILTTELSLVIIGGIFVLEALSVVLQVISFRLTGRLYSNGSAAPPF